MSVAARGLASSCLRAHQARAAQRSALEARLEAAEHALSLDDHAAIPAQNAALSTRRSCSNMSSFSLSGASWRPA
jgi:hypothetical protein